MSKYYELAEYLLFARSKTSDSLQKELTRLGLEFRKGKTVADVKKAIEKALKNGYAKVETELSMAEINLKMVFKPIRNKV